MYNEIEQSFLKIGNKKVYEKDSLKELATYVQGAYDASNISGKEGKSVPIVTTYMRNSAPETRVKGCEGLEKCIENIKLQDEVKQLQQKSDYFSREFPSDEPKLENDPVQFIKNAFQGTDSAGGVNIDMSQATGAIQDITTATGFDEEPIYNLVDLDQDAYKVENFVTYSEGGPLISNLANFYESIRYLGVNIGAPTHDAVTNRPTGDSENNIPQVDMQILSNEVPVVPHAVRAPLALHQAASITTGTRGIIQASALTSQACAIVLERYKRTTMAIGKASAGIYGLFNNPKIPDAAALGETLAYDPSTPVSGETPEQTQRRKINLVKKRILATLDKLAGGSWSEQLKQLTIVIDPKTIKELQPLADQYFDISGLALGSYGDRSSVIGKGHAYFRFLFSQAFNLNIDDVTILSHPLLKSENAGKGKLLFYPNNSQNVRMRAVTPIEVNSNIYLPSLQSANFYGTLFTTPAYFVRDAFACYLEYDLV